MTSILADLIRFGSARVLSRDAAPLCSCADALLAQPSLPPDPHPGLPSVVRSWLLGCAMADRDGDPPQNFTETK